jgi:hypothetical protein
MAGDILVNELRSLTRSLASEAGNGLGYGVNNRLIGLGPKRFWEASTRFGRIVGKQELERQRVPPFRSVSG